jgi:hypothetical protein
MTDKTLPDKDLDTPPDEAPQEWETVSIALSRELKEQFFAKAKAMHLRPSQYGRILIAQAVERDAA